MATTKKQNKTKTYEKSVQMDNKYKLPKSHKMQTCTTTLLFGLQVKLSLIISKLFFVYFKHVLQLISITCIVMCIYACISCNLGCYLIRVQEPRIWRFWLNEIFITRRPILMRTKQYLSLIIIIEKYTNFRLRAAY